MQFRWLPAFVVFLGSYLPLTVILAVQDVPKNIWGRAVCNPFGRNAECTAHVLAHPAVAFGAIAGCLASVMLSLLVIRRIPYRYRIEVVETKPIPNDLINYVFPYVVSFMGLSYSDPDKLAGFIVFLLWMFAITYRSGQMAMNPLLLLFGFQLHEAKLRVADGERIVRLLARHAPGTGLLKAELVQDFYFVESTVEEGF